MEVVSCHLQIVSCKLSVVSCQRGRVRLKVQRSSSRVSRPESIRLRYSECAINTGAIDWLLENSILVSSLLIT
jgi:hypothetical protein